MERKYSPDRSAFGWGRGEGGVGKHGVFVFIQWVTAAEALPIL